mgnify:FL=1
MTKNKNGVQGLIGLERFTRFGVKNDKVELSFFSVEPTNISVLSAANIDVKIHHLMMLLSTIPDLEILALDSCECFDSNKNHLRKRLEKEQIIEGYEVKVNQLKLGYHITAFINLEVAPVQKPDFYPFIKSCHNVVECNCVTGNYSMLLKVVFPSTMELDTFIGQLQKFGRTSTQIVFSTPVEPRGIDVNVELPVND